MQNSKTSKNKNFFVFAFVFVFVGILAFVFAFVARVLQQVSLFLHKLGAVIRGGSLFISIMAKRNLQYEHGYAQGYEYHQYAGGSQSDAEREIVRRFGKKTLYSSYGKGFIQGFLDHKNGLEQKY